MLVVMVSLVCHAAHAYIVVSPHLLLGNSTGCPGVFFNNPHPHLPIPVPTPTGVGFPLSWMWVFTQDFECNDGFLHTKVAGQCTELLDESVELILEGHSCYRA